MASTDESDYSYVSENDSSEYSSEDSSEDGSEDSSDESSDSEASEEYIPAKRPKLKSNAKNGSEWIWTKKDNVPQIKPFKAIPGIKNPVLHRLGSNPSPLNFFEEVFDKHFWQTLTTETNRYADQVIKGDSAKKKKIDDAWYPVTVDEMKAYIALSIIMTQVKKPCVQMNWSKRVIIYTPIYEQTMPYRRFLAITRFLHFANNDDSNKNDKMTKIRNMVEYFNTKFNELYTPEEDMSIDESLMKFKGRLGCVVFVRIKRARYGIKFYKLCESNSGYCLNFKIYTGDNGDKSCGANELNVSETVVKELSELIINKGYTLFLDNWYSSPTIFEYLLAHDTNAIGTVRNNRKNMPKELNELKLKKGETATRSSRGILALKWSDRKDVYLLSTKHMNAQMTDTGKKKVHKGGRSERNKEMKPKCVMEYNHGMGGVDRQDQVLACFPVMRKFLKGYRKIFFYMFDMALFNSYVLYSKTQPKKNHYVNYRLDVAEQMLKTVVLPDYNVRGRPAHGDTPLRLQAIRWGHFAKHIDPTPKKSNPTRVCKVCWKHKKRSETTCECKKCLVALHVPHCFEKYHTQHNY